MEAKQKDFNPMENTLKQAVTCMKYADVNLVCKDGKLMAHRCVLTMASTFLRELLQSCSSRSCCQPSCVFLPDVKASTMSQMLHMIYTGKTPFITVEDHEELISLILMLGIRPVGPDHEKGGTQEKFEQLFLDDVEEEERRDIEATYAGSNSKVSVIQKSQNCSIASFASWSGSDPSPGGNQNGSSKGRNSQDDLATSGSGKKLYPSNKSCIQENIVNGDSEQDGVGQSSQMELSSFLEININPDIALSDIEDVAKSEMTLVSEERGEQLGNMFQNEEITVKSEIPPLIEDQGLRGLIEGDTTSMADSWKPFRCQHCGKYFTQHNSLTRHINSHHIIQKRYFCNFSSCTYNATRKDSLTRHIRSKHDQDAGSSMSLKRQRLNKTKWR